MNMVQQVLISLILGTVIIVAAIGAIFLGLTIVALTIFS